MPDAPPRRCCAPGCDQFGVFARGRCQAHERERGRDKHRAQRALGYLDDARWARFRQLLIGLGNVVCQRVVDGRRCSKAARIFHHIVPVEARPDLIYDHRNVVGVCQSCHPRPTDPDQGTYVPTLWREPGSGGPLPAWSVQPGDAPRPGQELWSLAERLARLSTGG